MTEAQLLALKDYIDLRCKFLICAGLNIPIDLTEREGEQLEDKFDAIMLGVERS